MGVTYHEKIRIDWNSGMAILWGIMSETTDSDRFSARILALEYIQGQTLALVLAKHEDPRFIDVLRHEAKATFYPSIPAVWRQEAKGCLDAVYGDAEQKAEELRAPPPRAQE